MNKPSFWQLGWRTLWRDLRAGELRLIVLAVALAVTALTAVGFFADRIKGGLQRDARQMLGGDAVLASDQPSPAALIEQARQLGLQQVSSLSFPTMARAPDELGAASRLVALKAVVDGYPLRGKLQLAERPGAAVESVRAVPPVGQAWVDAAVLQSLRLDVGQTLLLGEMAFVVSRVIVVEPDRGAGFVNFAPRVMINQADLAATALVQPASRVSYRLALAGDDAAVQRFVEQTTQRIANGGDSLRGVRIESLESGRPELRQTLDRAEKFLNLVALLAALLSAVAVALASRGFAQRHLDDCAMLRVLGQSQRTIALSYSVEFALIGCFASALGLLLGFVLHHVFVWLLAGLVDSALPAATLWPVLFGLGMGLTLLLAFGLPPVLQLAQVPALRVIRRDLGALKPATLAVLALGIAGFAALLLTASSDRTLGLIAVGGFAAASLAFAALSYGAVWLLRASVRESSAPRWLVLATRQLAARPAHAVLQISALALGLLALVLLVLLRTDLVASWRGATPADAPNRFVINIMPEQGSAFVRQLRQAGITQFDWFPMVRGRLVVINGEPVAPERYPDERARRLLEREFNLSFAAAAPAHNRIVAGQWRAEEADALSLEEGIAKTLGLKLGDRLTFEMGGVQKSAQVTSLRKVDWGSMHANFFVMYPVSTLGAVPTTYLSAFRAPGLTPSAPGSAAAGALAFDDALVRAFPNVTNVDMSSTIDQVQKVLDQVIRAVEFLFVFTLLAGLVVLLATVAATREQRARELAIMRALGARSSLLRQIQRAELIGVGLLAGLLASALAALLGWALARYVFEFDWSVSLWVPLFGALAGAALALAAGWWGLREVLNRPVLQTLRQAG